MYSYPVLDAKEHLSDISLSICLGTFARKGKMRTVSEEYYEWKE
jgi:hypothetical protein